MYTYVVRFYFSLITVVLYVLYLLYLYYLIIIALNPILSKKYCMKRMKWSYPLK